MVRVSEWTAGGFGELTRIPLILRMCVLSIFILLLTFMVGRLGPNLSYLLLHCLTCVICSDALCFPYYAGRTNIGESLLKNDCTLLPRDFVFGLRWDSSGRVGLYRAGMRLLLLLPSMVKARWERKDIRWNRSGGNIDGFASQRYKHPSSYTK